MFDITSLAATETTDIELTNPSTGEPLLGDDSKPCSVTVYGPAAKQFAAAQTASSNRATKRARARGRADMTPEEIARNTADFLADITVSFNAFNYKGMEPGREAFFACYSDATVGFIRDQVNAGAGDWGNFTKAAPSS